VVAGLVGSLDVASTLVALRLGAVEVVPGTALLIAWLGGQVGLAAGKGLGLVVVGAAGVGVERLAAAGVVTAWVGWLAAAGWTAVTLVAVVSNLRWVVSA
jgi:hypothetical protein